MTTLQRPSARHLAAGLVLALALLAGCSKNNKFEPPAKLTDFHATVKIQKLWSTSMGGAAPRLRLGIGPAIDGDRVFAANHDGAVAAYALQTGKALWHVKTKAKLAGGPGVGQGLVVVGSSYGDVIALDESSGAVKWKIRINSEILSAPVVGNDVVALRTVDGRLHALAIADGHSLWSAEQQVPRLSLRGVATPAITGDLAVSGFDNGRVLAVSLHDGATAWESVVAPPSGRTELERLVDIDSPIRVAEDDLYVVAFQGRVARIARDTGQIWWARDLSSYRGLALDDEGVYVSTADGQLVKIGRRTGVEVWRTDVLKNRRLSAPVVVGSQVIVADLKGYVHVFDTASGMLAARTSFGSHPVAAAPVAGKGVIVLMNDKEQLAAFRIVTPTN